MAPSSSLRRTAASFVFVALLVLASLLPQLQATRTTPTDDAQGRVQQQQQVRPATTTTTSSSGSGSTPAASAAVQERPPPFALLLLPPPPPTTIEEASPRSRMLGSVPSPGVGH
ncbi:unnamed protein product [Miscanthus lutarioriparius]|uniref:Uncharacterized protein n=1 Tax=Miscanthus lutarioriparius TaxID=422564 RepID=A0A811PA68_9POAL|nr:unnamed protein product [Miscanthus lutarioriparius]